MKTIYTLGYARVLLAGLTTGYFARDLAKVKDVGFLCSGEKGKLVRDIHTEALRIEDKVYSDEGFQFSPGGGFYFYPGGREKLTEEQRREISRKIETKLETMNQLTNRIDKITR